MISTCKYSKEMQLNSNLVIYFTLLISKLFKQREKVKDHIQAYLLKRVI